MASYEVGDVGEDSAATAQSRNLLYADGVGRAWDVVRIF